MPSHNCGCIVGYVTAAGRLDVMLEAGEAVLLAVILQSIDIGTCKGP